MIRFLAPMVVLVSCVVVAVPGAQAGQRLAGSTVCQLVPTSLVTGPDGNIWYTVAPLPQPTRMPFHSPVPQPWVGVPLQAGTSIYRMTRQGKVTAFPIPLKPQMSVTVDHITSGPGGNLWFMVTTDENSTTKVFIGRMTPHGSSVAYPVRLPPWHGFHGAGIALGSDGNIWFSVDSVDMIGRISPRGDITEFPAPTLPGQMIRGRDGNIWFATLFSGVGRITPQGVVRLFNFAPGIVDGMQALTVGPDGNLWFTNENQQVVRATAPGTVKAIPIPPVFADNGGVSSLASGSDHNLWFATAGGVIVRMTLKGEFTGFPLPQGMDKPRGLVRGGDGNLWFGAVGGWIGRITPQGRVTRFSACPA